MPNLNACYYLLDEGHMRICKAGYNCERRQTLYQRTRRELDGSTRKFDANGNVIAGAFIPPEEIRMDCFLCGGENTMVGTRAKVNGHFRGRCEKCGAKVIE